MSDRLPTSVSLILAERARQVVEEGYDGPHDMEHEPDQLAAAGATYALPDQHRDYPGPDGEGVPGTWPWASESWKPAPDDRLRELVKAGALIVAEIDRVIMEERLRELNSRTDG